MKFTVSVFILISIQINYVLTNYLNCHITNNRIFNISIIECKGSLSTPEPQILQKDFLNHLQFENNKTNSIQISAKLSKIENNWTIGLNTNEISWTTVAFTNNSLISVDVGVFDSLTKLNNLFLKNNKFKSLPIGLFDQNTELLLLDLSSNDLTTLNARIFNKLKKLKYLLLDYNKLNTLPLGIFADTKNLIKINLSENRFTYIETGIFDEIPTLNIIDLSFNPLMRLNSGIFNGLPIKELVLMFCNISEIDVNSLKELSQLQTLYLNNNNLTDIPDDIFSDLINLEILFLTNNNLEIVSRKLFAQQNNLMYLDLSQNQLTQLPALNLQKLSFLNLDHNQIRQIEINQIINLRSLDYLFFSNNNLTYLNSDVLEILNTVTRIDYHGNPWSCPCLQEIESERINHTSDNQLIDTFNNNVPKCITGNKLVCVKNIN